VTVIVTTLDDSVGALQPDRITHVFCTWNVMTHIPIRKQTTFDVVKADYESPKPL
jgi:hypothetical protein